MALLGPWSMLLVRTGGDSLEPCGCGGYDICCLLLLVDVGVLRHRRDVGFLGDRVANVVSGQIPPHHVCSCSDGPFDGCLGRFVVSQFEEFQGLFGLRGREFSVHDPEALDERVAGFPEV